MATNMTYDDLESSIKSYTEQSANSTFVGEIPNFINLAENRVALDLKQQGFQAVVTGTLPLNCVLPKPAFWRETISFNYTDASGVVTQILMRNYEYLRNFWPNAATQDLPRYYADYNFENFFLAPTPNSGFTFELVYYARLTPLSSANQSNWMTVNIPQTLLFACLIEAYAWLKNSEQAGIWENRYKESAASVITENQDRLGSRGEKVSRG